MLYILSVIATLFPFITLCIVVRRKQGEEKKYRDAAYNLLKEEYLTSSLRKSDINKRARAEELVMVYLKIQSSSQKLRYVFNPEKPITIGRDQVCNTIAIPYPTISINHGKIYLTQNQVCYQDLNSSNGTYIQRGMQRYYIESGAGLLLENKDKIIFENVEIKVILFNFEIIR